MYYINKQPMQKAESSDGSMLLIHSIFYTVQGEGPHAGKPAVFVRLGGCNLQCPGCDTEYTKGSAYESIDSILTRIGMAFDGNPVSLVVITGGEPFRQNIGPLINKIYSATYWTIQVESNGTLALPESLERRYIANRFGIVVSPKAGKVHPSLWPHIIAYKYVLDWEHIDRRDGLPTSVLGMPAAPARPHEGYDGPIYVNPADEVLVDREGHQWSDKIQMTHNSKACVSSAMAFGYTVGIQMHKLLKVA